MKGIELNIYYGTDEVEKLENLGLDVDLDNYDIRKVTFFNINAIGRYIENGQDYCTLYCNGTTFVCVDDYENVKSKLLIFNN